MTKARRICLLLAIVAVLAGCATVVTTGTGKPDKAGGYEARKFCGVTYSLRPVRSKAEKRDDAIVAFLGWVAIAAFVGVLVGVVSLYLDRAGKVPCPWWDETLAIAGLVLVVALLGIWWYGWIKWILTGGVAAYLVFAAAKVWRSRKNAAEAPEPAESRNSAARATIDPPATKRPAEGAKTAKDGDHG